MTKLERRMNSTIHDTLNLTISDMNEQHMKILVELIEKSDRNLTKYISEDIVYRKQIGELSCVSKNKNEMNWGKKLMTTQNLFCYLLKDYPDLKINYILEISRIYLCDDVVIYLQKLLNDLL